MMTLLAVFLAGALAGALAHARITTPRRRPSTKIDKAVRRQPKLTTAPITKATLDAAAVTDVASALKNMGAAPAAALTAARRVVAERPAAGFQEHFRVALRELPSTTPRGRHAVN